METIGHLINFTVDKETCIGCRACAEQFPAQFQMDDDANKAYTTGVPAGEVDPHEPVIACPVDSIAIVDFKGRLLLNPQQARDKTPLPAEGVALMVKDYEALPPDKRPIIEVKPKTAPVPAGEPGKLPAQWFSQFASLEPTTHEQAPPRFRPWVTRLLRLTSPIWGGFSDRCKTRLVELSGARGTLSPGAATTQNGLLNFVIYPGVLWYLLSGRLDILGFKPLGLGIEALLMPVGLLGVFYAFVEFAWRLKDEIFEWGITEHDRVYPATLYAAPASGLAVRWLERACSSPTGRSWLYDPATTGGVSADPEVERLYGRAIHATPLAEENGVRIDVEFPSRLRLSSGRVVELPDYVHDVASRDSRIVLRAWLADPIVEALWSYRDPFPLSFEREIQFPGPVESIEQERQGKKLRLKVRLTAA